MKVKVEIVVDVDPAKWVAEFGVARGEVREDVKTYITTAVQCSPAIEATDAEVTVR